MNRPESSAYEKSRDGKVISTSIKSRKKILNVRIAQRGGNKNKAKRAKTGAGSGDGTNVRHGVDKERFPLWKSSNIQVDAQIPMSISVSATKAPTEPF